jgi:hypothetical protein
MLQHIFMGRTHNASRNIKGRVVDGQNSLLHMSDHNKDGLRLFMARTGSKVLVNFCWHDANERA